MPSIPELRCWIERTYGARNRMIGVESLLEGLDAATSRLTKGLRKKTLSHQQVHDEVSRIVARVFALEALLEVDVLSHLRRKYPGYCSYCGYVVCRCGEGCEPGPMVGVVPEADAPIAAYQEMLAHIYGFKNAQLGCQGVLVHIFEEIAEVRRARLRAPDQVEEELTDVLAHALGLATLFSLDVERAVRARYGQNCPECELVVCDCSLDS